MKDIGRNCEELKRYSTIHRNSCRIVSSVLCLLKEGIYVIGFFYPVVAQGKARIRVQVSAAHEISHLDQAVAAFTKVGKELGVLK